MTKTTLPITLILMLFLFGCTEKNFKDDKTYYKAINKQDTALLSIAVYQNRFYGEFEMIYGKHGRDSGTVRGQIYGDTLKGEYQYLSYGGSKSIAPFVLLKRAGKFRLGRGLKATYMGIPFYSKAVPIDYEIGFIFEQVDKPSEETP